MNWFAWGVLLLLQNASFTWTSRARNSGSVWRNVRASIFSNGIWFIGQMFVVNVFYVVKTTGDWSVIAQAAVFYTAFTTTGSALMQKLLLRVESGKGRVGAR